MASEQQHKGSARDEQDQDQSAASDSGHLPSAKRSLDSDVDSILDEIDDVLEENAAEFCRRSSKGW